MKIKRIIKKTKVRKIFLNKRLKNKFYHKTKTIKKKNKFKSVLKARKKHMSHRPRPKRKIPLYLQGITGQIVAGKLYRLRIENHFYKKPMSSSIENIEEEFKHWICNIFVGSLVIITKILKNRYIQIMFKEHIGYIWLDPTVGISEHFSLVEDQI